MNEKPYHQGQLDYFCAVYALINALRLTHGLRLHQARGILAGALFDCSMNPMLWSALLQNRTDSHWLVEYLLGRFCREGALALRMAKLPPCPPGMAATTMFDELHWYSPPVFSLEAMRPEDLYRSTAFSGKDTSLSPMSGVWRMDDFQRLLTEWLPGGGIRKFFENREETSGRSLLLRFHRYLSIESLPAVSHWSTGRTFSRKTLHLYDCTQNRQAVHHLPLRGCALYPGELDRSRLLAVELESLYFLERI